MQKEDAEKLLPVQLNPSFLDRILEKFSYMLIQEIWSS